MTIIQNEILVKKRVSMLLQVMLTTKSDRLAKKLNGVDECMEPGLWDLRARNFIVEFSKELRSIPKNKRKTLLKHIVNSDIKSVVETLGIGHTPKIEKRRWPFTIPLPFDAQYGNSTRTQFGYLLGAAAALRIPRFPAG